MICKNCSSELPPNSLYCHVCGKSCAEDNGNYLSIAIASEKKRKIIKRVIISFVSVFAVTVIGILFIVLYTLGFFSGAFGGIFGGFLGGALIFGNSEEKTTVSEVVDVSRSEYQSYFDKIDEYLAVNNYNDALLVITEAELIYGAEDEIVLKKKEIIVKKGLAALSTYENKGDFKGALTYIMYNLSEIENEAEIQRRKTLYAEKYRSQILASAENYFSQGKTDNAISVIEDGLVLLTDDEMLLSKKEEYLNSSGETENNDTPVPDTKDEIIAFYAGAVNRVEYKSEAGFTMKEWEQVDEVNSGNERVDSLIMTGLGAFMTKEKDAESITFSKGDVGIIEEFPDWYLTDNDMVEDATLNVNENGNYDITINMVEEDTPTADSMLEQVTETVLIWEKIEDLLLNNSTVKAILTDYEDVHVYYENFTINAEIAPDGRIIYLKHTADINASIGKAEIAHVFTMENKTGHMMHYCEYYNFTY